MWCVLQCWRCSACPYRVHAPGHQLRHAGLDVLDGQLVQCEKASQDPGVFI